MADTRENLIELMFVGQVLADAECDKQADCNKCPYNAPNACRVGFIADHLIANGATVQELDGCEYCKEDNEGYRKMIGAFSITNPFHGSVWNIETCHCRPRQIYFCPMCGRKLPQPPKGE